MRYGVIGVGAIYTRPIEIARAAGYRMRKLEMLEAELRFLSEDQGAKE